MTQPSPTGVATVTPDAAVRTPASGRAAATGAPAVPDTRSVSEIEADLGATRARLVGRIDELQAYVTPKAVARRQVDKVRGWYVDEFGGIRPERVLVTAGVLAAFVGVVVLRRRARR